MRSAASLVIAFATIAVTPVEAPGCGPWFPAALFNPPSRPEVSLRDFYGGKLGHIQPSLWLEYLIPAYRVLSAKPAPPPSEQPGTLVPPDPLQTAYAAWVKQRSRVAADELPQYPASDRDIAGGEFVSFPNCLADSYRTAAQTLDLRIAQLGARHAGVISWVAAQDAVFRNCSKGAELPPAPEPALPPTLKADREYQIASAQFYAMQFDEARAGYMRIARNASSPWRDSGPYLAARCLIRKATLQQSSDKVLLGQAESELRAIAKTSAKDWIRKAAADLADFTSVRLRPSEYLASLANRLSDPAQDNRFYANVNEFDYVWVTRGTADSFQTKSDLLDWLLTMRGRKPVDPARSVSEAPWLIAALVHATPGQASLAKLIPAAQAVPPDSPAYPTVAFHLARLTATTRSDAEKRQQLDRILANLRKTAPAPVRNRFLELRLRLATTLDEFIAAAVRTPGVVGSNNVYDGQDWPSNMPAELLGPDAVDVLNRRVPVDVWAAISKSARIPAHIRRDLVRAAWTRALALGNDAVRVSLTPALIEAHPELKPLLPDNASFTAVLALLNAPGLSAVLADSLLRVDAESKPLVLTDMDSFRRNWWCTASAPGAPDPPAADFLSPEQKARGLSEAEAIADSGGAQVFFGKAIADWVEAHKTDPRAPRALHLVVRGTRYGCASAGTSAISRRAFRLLHKLYPASEWAKKTPYHF